MIVLCLAMLVLSSARTILHAGVCCKQPGKALVRQPEKSGLPDIEKL